jgi:hypothetical protein
MLTDQQNAISVSLNKYGTVINNQARRIEHHQNAIENIMEWLGEELGDEAVDRLKARLGVEKKPDEGTNSVVCGDAANT